MKKIIIFSILLLTSSLTLSMDKLGKEDRLHLRTYLRHIKTVLEYEDKKSAKQKLQLAEDYQEIVSCLDKNNIPHPKERDFSWLYYLEIKLAEKLSPNTKELSNRQAVYNEAQRIMESEE